MPAGPHPYHAGDFGEGFGLGPSPGETDKLLREGLVRDGLVAPMAMARAEDHRSANGGSLEDSLLELGICSERDVLRVLARAFHLQYLLGEKAAQLQVPEGLLDRVPVRLAEAHFVVPFRLDEAEVLWVLTAAPIEESVLQDLLLRTGANAVNRLVVRRYVLWSAIRRHYYRDPTAFDRPLGRIPVAKPERADREDPFDTSDIVEITKSLKCPSCGAPATADSFQCAKCGLLLNHEASARRRGTQASIVYALLSRTGGADRPREHPAEESDRTVRVSLPADASQIPRLVGGLDVFERPLHEFEAFLASFIDGETDVETIAAAAGVTELEAHAIIRSLMARKIVQLSKKAAPPPPGTPPPPPRREPHTPASGGFPLGRLTLVRGGEPTTPNTPALGVHPSEAPTPPDGVAPAGPPTPFGGVRPADARPRATYDPAASALQQAVALERRGKLAEAIEVLEGGISRLSNPAPLLNKLALILVDQRGDYRKAEKLLRKASGLDPKSEVYQRNLYKVLGLEAVAALGIKGK